MKRFLSLFLFLICLGTFSSCFQESQASQARNYFFDLPGYFQQEAVRLGSPLHLRKTVVQHGKSQTLDSDSADLIREMDIFVQCNINKGGLTDKYRGDTLAASDGSRLLRYVATTQPAILDTLSVLVRQEQVVWLNIKRHTRSSIAREETELSYHALSDSFSIRHVQRVTGSNPQVLEIRGRFSRP